MAHLEGAYEQITARLGGIEARLGRLEDNLNDKIGGLGSELRGELAGLRGELIARMDRQFYWILSLIVVSILVPLFLRLFNM
ncbi:MAG: hypothetical protein ACRDIC_02520 [bacterium]